MNLIITKNPKLQKDPQLFYLFIENYLIPEMYLYFINTLDMAYVYLWDKYFKNTYDWHLNEYPPSAQDILLLGVSNLKCYEHKNHYIIQIKNNQIVPRTTAKLDDLCYEINYGNLNTPPYPIFTETFKYGNSILYGLFEEWCDSFE